MKSLEINDFSWRLLGDSLLEHVGPVPHPLSFWAPLIYGLLQTKVLYCKDTLGHFIDFHIFPAF